MNKCLDMKKEKICRVSGHSASASLAKGSLLFWHHGRFNVDSLNIMQME